MVHFDDPPPDDPDAPTGASRGAASLWSGISHQDIRDQLSDYIDDSLQEWERERVFEHLRSCRACRVYEATLRAAVKAVASLPREKAPESAQERLRAIAPPEEQCERPAAATAARAFEKTLEGLGFSDPESVLGDPESVGKRAALLVAADAAWRRHLGLLFGIDDVREILRLRTRHAVHDRVRRGRLLALPTERGAKLFPAFQFTRSGAPHPSLPAILRAFSGATETPYTVASWFVTPQALLQRKTPAEWLGSGHDPELVKEAARRAAARLSQ